jgi:hypothetical protein
MRDRKLKIISGVISILLFVTLIGKLAFVPGGLILSGLYLGGMLIVAISIACLLATSILKLFVRKYSFSTLYFISISFAFIAFHYKLYSPTLKIIVPDGYTGEVSLILSNVDHNVLTVDSNGVGYVTKWTFEKTWSQPDVFTTNGKSINNQCVGFNPSTFWALSKFCCVDKKVIRSLSFDIVPEDKVGQDIHYSRGLGGLVDTKMLYGDE